MLLSELAPLFEVGVIEVTAAVGIEFTIIIAASPIIGPVPVVVFNRYIVKKLVLISLCWQPSVGLALNKATPNSIAVVGVVFEVGSIKLM